MELYEPLMYLWLNVYGNIFVQALRWQQQLQWVHKYYGYSISIKTSSHDTFCYHPAPIFFLPPLLQCFLSLGCPFQGWPLIITWILVHVWAISLYINYGSLQKKKKDLLWQSWEQDISMGINTNVWEEVSQHVHLAIKITVALPLIDLLLTFQVKSLGPDS